MLGCLAVKNLSQMKWGVFVTVIFTVIILDFLIRHILCLFIISLFSFLLLFYQNSHLYYENTTGTYYYYDEPSATYKFHSKIDISNNQEVTVNKDDEVDKEEKESCKEYSEDDEENDLEGL